MTLRAAAGSFVAGYARARLDDPEVAELVSWLETSPIESRPFACEGIAMALRLQDVRDGSDRLTELESTLEPVWIPLVRLGDGCARARLGESAPSDPMVADGYGFECGRRDGVLTPGGVDANAAVTRGRGRALWFATDGRLETCARVVTTQPEAVAAALWRGIATACTFAGDPRGAAPHLAEAAGPFSAHVVEGVRFASDLWCALTDQPPGRVLAVRAAVVADGP